jgi:transposase
VAFVERGVARAGDRKHIIHIQLPERERDTLQAEFRTTTDRKLRDRLRSSSWRPAGDGRPGSTWDLEISTRIFPSGLEASAPRKAKGADPKIPGRLADEIQRWVIGGLAACGPGRANWTYAELASHLFQTHGIDASRSAMLRFCKELGVRVYRPTYWFLRADPAKQAKVREELAGLKKRRMPASSSC